MWMEIIKYVNTQSVDVRFDDGVIIKDRSYYEFRDGNIKNLMNPNTFGVGFIGYGRHVATINRIHTKVYDAWHGMMQRCYDPKILNCNPTYIECTVCKEWHNFQNFAEWYEDNYIEYGDEKMCLDKDILIKGNKIYSPDTCIFVDQRINKLFVKSNRGELPIGVHYFKRDNKYTSHMNRNGKLIHLGLFNTVEEAFLTYKRCKEKYIKEIADDYMNRYQNFSLKLYNALYAWEIDLTD